ncbi:MAG: proton-conducting transporter membrane subunit, partial [Clostridia bacterium]
ATGGLFLSDTLYSAFLFFEVVSLASYPWVAQEETPDAMRAAQTYLFIAIIGGLVMLMGLFLLPSGLATAGFGELSTLAAGVDVERLWLPALLILFGFGAKAGAFPLHIWLPKAHPVAPAPASALLSGILTKAGVFGMLVLSCMLMRGSADWGDLIFRLGVITMFLGALLAIFSVNLKRTLACSSLSQIGFIMVGIGLCGLLGDENGLAAFGTVGHMVNHSLFKLVLFLCAGVVALNTHLLELNDVRGFGRRKPALHIAFLLGALGISGIPLFSGYLSKSLLHEGIVECIAHVTQLGGNARPYAIAEWIFLISGGMTLCYMLKLYLCLFWQRHPTRQAEFDAMTHYLSPLSKFALLFSAALIP